MESYAEYESEITCRMEHTAASLYSDCTAVNLISVTLRKKNLQMPHESSTSKASALCADTLTQIIISPSQSVCWVWLTTWALWWIALRLSVLDKGQRCRQLMLHRSV